MTPDPEEFLADLGFAETDLRMRIPDRFFESASRAQGIDVDSFRRSLEHDDLYGSAVRKEYSLIYLVYYRGHDCPVQSFAPNQLSKPTSLFLVGARDYRWYFHHMHIYYCIFIVY